MIGSMDTPQEQLGTLRLAGEDDRPFPSAQHSAVAEDPSHDAVMLRLLADDPAVRRRAFAQAISRRWLERGEATIVRAVSVDQKADALDRLAFGRHMAAVKSVDLTFIGHRDDLLYFVGRAVLPDRYGGEPGIASDLIMQEAAARGLHVHGIGTARLDRKDEDLSISAEQARRAAEIVAWLPHLAGVADISQLGAWVLLDSIDADGSHVGMFSPAALQLWEHGNDVQLETVETFLDTCGRVRDACEQLHIHRTTLYYRLDNLPDAVRAALNDGMSRSALHICLKLLRYWRATGRA